MTERKFHREEYRLVVLSEGPPRQEPLGLEDAAYAIIWGECVGTFERTNDNAIDGKEMAQALYDAGSDPGFFQLDDDGNDIE